MKTKIGLLVILATMLPAYVSAQIALSPGDRVRLSSAELSGEFTVMEVQDNSLVLSTASSASSTVHVETSSLTRLDVSRGQQSHAILGASLGLAAGAAGTVVYCQAVDKGGCEVLGDDVTLGVALINSAIGGLVGGIAGYFIKTDRWEPASLSGSSLASIKVRPTFSDGIGFAASIPVGQ